MNVHEKYLRGNGPTPAPELPDAKKVETRLLQKIAKVNADTTTLQLQRERTALQVLRMELITEYLEQLYPETPANEEG